MALNAATDHQYHLLDQDGTADDQMDQLQGDHDAVLITALACNPQNSASAEPPPPQCDSSFLAGLLALSSASCKAPASVLQESLHVLPPAWSSTSPYASQERLLST
ncbi:hypothetical protein MRX96_031264 [Rhipicephalus microplus]